VTADASEVGRKSGKISTIPPFCNWLIQKMKSPMRFRQADFALAT
jgi:hypothetical protein